MSMCQECWCYEGIQPHDPRCKIGQRIVANARVHNKRIAENMLSVAHKISVDDDEIKVEQITAQQTYIDPASEPDESAEMIGYNEGGCINLYGTPIEEEPLTLTQTPQPINLCFMDDGGTVGEFKYDRDAKRWTFEGNMDEAAKQFAKFMYAHFQSIIDGDHDGLLDYSGRPKEEPEPEKVWPENMQEESNFDPRPSLNYFRAMWMGKDGYPCTPKK